MADCDRLYNPAMQLLCEDIPRICADREIYESLLELDGRCLVEFGCGAAANTRLLASGGATREIIAFEVDERQHARNLAAPPLPNVSFRYGGAEAIDLPDASADVVFMFKSLHHVPRAELGRALGEIHRILKPRGYLYVSEPLFMGAFNDIIRLFHDEEAVRRAAFDALCVAVDAGLFEAVDEVFYRAPSSYRDFADFDARMIRVTHTAHRLTPAVYAEVERRFAAHCTADGARFENPMRVDLLRRR